MASARWANRVFERAARLSEGPWLSWEWWAAYNNVKHERGKNFADANQQNALTALCRWLALLFYLYKNEIHLQPYPAL